MASTTIDYAQGSTSFLLGLLNGVLPTLNVGLAAKVTGGATVPFQLAVGDKAGAGGNWLVVSYSGEVPTARYNTEKIIRLAFNLLCQIHTAGDDTSANFEMAKQVAADHLRTVFDDDSKVLSPKIDAGLIGVVQAYKGERGAIVDLFPRLLADKVTVVRGFSMQYALSFSLKVR